MKILLPVTSAKIWPESGMLTVNITFEDDQCIQLLYTRNI